jgi:hypothetical protein
VIWQSIRSTEEWQCQGDLYQCELDARRTTALSATVSKKKTSDVPALITFSFPYMHGSGINGLVPTYANEIVDQRIIELGVSVKIVMCRCSQFAHYAIQSNLQRHYIKLPVSIFNTAVYRGLPSKRNLAAPAVTAWLKQIHQQDQDLQNTGVIFLGEVATLTIHQPCFDRIDGAPYQFKELFGCLWRESVDRYVDPSQQVHSLKQLYYIVIFQRSIDPERVDPSIRFESFRLVSTICSSVHESIITLLVSLWFGIFTTR